MRLPHRFPNPHWHIPGLNAQVGVFLVHSLLFHIGLLGITDVLLNFYLVSIGYEADAIGTLQALPRLGGFLTGLPVGLLANRLGKRRILVASTLGVAACTALTVLLPGLFLLALTRFLLGFFFGANQVVRAPYMVTLTERDEHTAQFSYQNFISMIAVAAGSFVGGLLPLWIAQVFLLPEVGNLPAQQSAPAYQGAILVAAFIILLSVLPILRLPADASDEADGNDTTRKQAIPWLAIVNRSWPLFIFGISGGLTFPFCNLFFRGQFGANDGLVGTILALGWLGMAFIPLLNPVWERRTGRVWALCALMIVSAVAFFGLGSAVSLLVAVPFYIVAIGTRNTMQPFYQPLLMDSLLAQYHNVASSVGLVLWNIGWFSATISFGVLQGTIGYSGIMMVVGLLLIINGFAIVAAFRPGRESLQSS